MKNLLACACLMSASVASAQNFSVRTAGQNADGIPQNWPISVQAIGTNQAPSPLLTMTAAEVGQLVSTNLAAYTAVQSNLLYAAESKRQEVTNYARLLALYNAIPGARATLRPFANATNALTTAQLTSALRQSADYQEKLMEFIQRVGPMLMRDLYRPEDDTTP